MLNVVILNGGRGASTIILSLLEHQRLHVTSVVNAYDDGKSTREIRKFIPGILGPSDYRKNLSHLIDLKTTNGKIFQDLLDYRFPNKTNSRKFISFLKLEKSNKIVKKLNLYNLTFEKFLALQEYLIFFLRYYKNIVWNWQCFFKFTKQRHNN